MGQVAGQPDGAGAHHTVMVPAEQRRQQRRQPALPARAVFDAPDAGDVGAAVLRAQQPDALAAKRVAEAAAQAFRAPRFPGLDVDDEPSGRQAGCPFDAPQFAQGSCAALSEGAHRALMGPPARPAFGVGQGRPDTFGGCRDVPMADEVEVSGGHGCLAWRRPRGRAAGNTGPYGANGRPDSAMAAAAASDFGKKCSDS